MAGFAPRRHVSFDALHRLSSPRSSSSSPAPHSWPSGPARTDRTAEPPGTATLVGDSLNVGVERYIADTLPRWRILANDQVGRTTSEGIAELVAGRAALSPYLVVSLGTNDGHDVEAFRAGVARVLKLAGPDRCVVWATIWRDGRPSDDFNDVLREAAEANKRLRLVAWAEMVEQRPELLAADGLHGNETGYRVGHGPLPRRCDRAPPERRWRSDDDGGLRPARTSASATSRPGRQSSSSTAAPRNPFPAPGARRASSLPPSSRRGSPSSRSRSCATGSSPGTPSTRAWTTLAPRSTSSTGRASWSASRWAAPSRSAWPATTESPRCSASLHGSQTGSRSMGARQAARRAARRLGPLAPGCSRRQPRSSRQGFERARRLGVEGSYRLIPRGLHGAAVRRRSGALVRLPRAEAWIEGVGQRLERFRAEGAQSLVAQQHRL